MKIRSKIVVAMVVICLISIFSMVLINYNLSIKSLENEIGERIQGVAANTAKELDKWMAVQKQSLEEIASSILYNDNYDYNYVFGFLNRQIKKNEGNEYYIGLNDGSLISGSGWIPPDDYITTERDWYIGAVSNENEDEIYISEPYVDAKTKDLIVSISRPLKKDEKILGVLCSDISIKHLIKVISNVKVGKDSYAFLVDDKGNILAHINDEYKPSESGYANINEILDGKLINIMKQSNLALKDRKVTDYDKVDRCFLFDDMKESGWKVGLAVSSKEVLKTINRVVKLTMITTVIILAIALVVSIYIANSISKPIMESVEIAENIGNLNLTDDVINEINMEREDEIGSMMRSYQNIIEKLRAFMEDMRESIKVTNQVYEKTISELNLLTDEAEDTSATTEELSAGMQEVAATTISISESTDEIDKATADFASKVEEGAKTANEISERAEKLNSQFIKAKDRTMDIYGKSKDEVSSAIKASKEVNKISVLSNAILEITDQTNLLALNAAIEAARAGESGRGFAVVADEIRKLAETSQETVGEIKSIAEGIISSVNQLVDNTMYLSNFLEKDVVKDYAMMMEAVEQYKEDGAALSNMISDLSAGSEELAASIGEISSAVREVSTTIEDSTKATTNIAEQNVRIAEIISEINDIMEKNREVSQKLNEIVSQVNM